MATPKLTLLLLLTIIPMSACSTNASSEPKYDEVDLIIYESCMNDGNNLNLRHGARLIFCEQYKPVKK